MLSMLNQLRKMVTTDKRQRASTPSRPCSKPDREQLTSHIPANSFFIPPHSSHSSRTPPPNLRRHLLSRLLHTSRTPELLEVLPGRKELQIASLAVLPFREEAACEPLVEVLTGDVVGGHVHAHGR